MFKLGTFLYIVKNIKGSAISNSQKEFEKLKQTFSKIFKAKKKRIY